MDARNVVIKKLAPSQLRLQLLDAKIRTNFLQKNAVGEFSINNDIAIIQETEKNEEEIFIPGPLTTELEVRVDVVQGHSVNISLEYAVMNQSSQIKKKEPGINLKKLEKKSFEWQYLQPDGECSARCDGGTQMTSAVSWNFSVRYRISSISFEISYHFD